MTQRRPSRGGGTRVSGSVIAGLLLVPATAIAAVAIVGATARPPSAEALEETTSTTQQDTEETTTTLVDVEGLSDEDALEEACTGSAQELLERELDESIDEIEIAALDALRQICEEHGMPIAGPPVPESIVRVISVTDDSDEYSDDDEYDRDDEHDDDHDEDDDDHDDDDDDDEDHDDEDHDDEDHDEDDD